MKKCKCKIKDHYIVIHGKGVRCCKCKKWIGKIRSSFYKRVSIKSNNKKYNRKKQKQILRKELKED